MPEYNTHNIVTTAEEDAIVAAVQKRIGASENQGYSTAVRFIIREFASHADPDGTILKSPPRTKIVKPSARKRAKARKFKPEAIPGVRRGMDA